MGLASTASSADLLNALRIPEEGVVYDLDAGRWPGMPPGPGHVPLTVTTWRTPRGFRIANEGGEFLGTNDVNLGFISDLVISTTHTGTHIDALCHVTFGEDSEWYGGGREERDLTDFGPRRSDASTMPPIISRGVLLDVAANERLDQLAAEFPITAELLDATATRQGTAIQAGDAVLIRSGYMRHWGDEADQRGRGAGLTLDAAHWLGDRGAHLVGGDTEALEVTPSSDPSNPSPVHLELLGRRGVYIVELAYLEHLAMDSVYEFLFICLPLRLVGGTASQVRPIAIR